ncbi:hypothetical protein [Clostridium fallax]|uniref:Flagellar hook-length control protein FliK n=1 Tax=Clostridium fallax TaxID=1533 RepID=A0A1M4SWH0_9CLOT|nr:hypothetical protein [Clostridium fallax]SHE36519.1 hypothetical protein SAMN05443638_101210 [Clostridium fallax]SQB08005.1 rhoptry protein [Clostridium fallax]
MPSIINVSNAVVSNNKKISSKLTFEVGEKFSGRIVKGKNGEESVVKLLDGWQFAAEIEGDSKSYQEGIVKFEVDGFENGKLKLKVIKESESQDNKEDKMIDSLLKSEGLKDDDTEVIKMMIKHNMNISKENVIKAKTLMKFKADIKENPEEIEKFINSFLASKGIEKASVEGQKVINILKNFFSSLENLSNEDLFMMLENNIDLTSDNIKSFLKLSKSREDIFNLLEKISENLEDGELKGENINSFINDEDLEFLKNIDKELESSFDKDMKANGNKNPNNLDLEKLIKENNKGLNLSNGDKDINLNDALKKAYENKNSKIDVLNILKTLIKDDNSGVKNTLKNIILNKTVESLGKEESNSLISTIKNLSEEDIVKNILTKAKESNTTLSKLNDKDFKEIIKDLTNKNIDINKSELNSIKEATKQSIINIIRNNGKENNELNSILNKFILEDSSVGKELQSILSENNIGIEGNKESLVNSIKEEELKNLLKDIKPLRDGKILEDGVTSKSSNIIEQELKEKGQLIKKIIEDIAHKDGLNTLNLSKDMINSLKIFNSLSDNYYMLDVPINFKEKEYECKLMIKDDRKSGKKIDSKDVKLVVTVKTINMGTIDGYIKIKDKNFNVDLKCDEYWVKPLDLGKEKLCNLLKDIGYNVNVIVSRRMEDATLTNCREFFNDGSISAIDIRV